MANFTPPTVSEVTDNAKKTADSFDKKPMATAYAVTTFVLIAVIIFLIVQINKLQNLNDYYTKTAFDQSFLIKKQSTVIEVQSKAIDKTSEAIDSTTIKSLQK